MHVLVQYWPAVLNPVPTLPIRYQGLLLSVAFLLRPDFQTEWRTWKMKLAEFCMYYSVEGRLHTGSAILVYPYPH